MDEGRRLSGNIHHYAVCKWCRKFLYQRPESIRAEKRMANRWTRRAYEARLIRDLIDDWRFGIYPD